MKHKLLQHFENLNLQFNSENHSFGENCLFLEKRLTPRSYFSASIEWDNCGEIEEVPILMLNAASGKSESLLRIPCVEFLVF